MGLEVHRCLLYRPEDSTEFVAHSGLIDYIGTGSTKEKAVKDLKTGIRNVRVCIQEHPDCPHYFEPKTKLFRDFNKNFKKDPTQYKSRFGLVDKDTFLWIYDLGVVDSGDL